MSSFQNFKYIYIGLTILSLYYLSKRINKKNIDFISVDINTIIKEKEEEKIFKKINNNYIENSTIYQNNQNNGYKTR